MTEDIGASSDHASSFTSASFSSLSSSSSDNTATPNVPLDLILKLTFGLAAAGILYLRQHIQREKRREQQQRELKVAKRREEERRNREEQDERLRTLLANKAALRARNAAQAENSSKDKGRSESRGEAQVQSYELMYEYDTYSSGSSDNDTGPQSFVADDDVEHREATGSTNPRPSSSSSAGPSKCSIGSSSKKSINNNSKTNIKKSPSLRMPHFGKLSLPTLVNGEHNPFQIDFKKMLTPHHLQTFYTAWSPPVLYEGPVFYDQRSSSSSSSCPTVPDVEDNDIYNDIDNVSASTGATIGLSYSLSTCQDASGVVYALKRVHYTDAVDYDRKWRQLTRECQLQVRAAGSYTLGVYALWTDEDEIVVATEHAVCGRLRSHLLSGFSEFAGSSSNNVIGVGTSTSTKKKTLMMSERGAARVIHAVAMALWGCHARDILHRGISLDTIFVCGFEYGNNENERDLVIKVGDFFTAMPSDEYGYSYESRLLLRNPAPEIYEEVPYGPPFDTWLAGLVLFQLLTGADPQPQKLCSDPQYRLEFPPNISEAAKDLTRSMLNVLPELRPTAREVVENPWVASHNK